MIAMKKRQNDKIPNKTHFKVCSYLPMSSLITGKAVRVSLDRNVLQSGQGLVATQAAEVLQMPEAVLGPGVLGAEDEFVTGLIQVKYFEWIL